MLAQTTDSGGNNGPMAAELQSMFWKAGKLVYRHVSGHHIKCYAHKLNLTVGHGLKALGQKVGPSKPTTPNNVPLPIPALEVNDGDDKVEVDDPDSEEDDADLPEKPDGVDDDKDCVVDGTNNTEGGEKSQDKPEDVVALALAKVSVPSYLFTVCFCWVSTDTNAIFCIGGYDLGSTESKRIKHHSAGGRFAKAFVSFLMHTPR